MSAAGQGLFCSAGTNFSRYSITDMPPTSVTSVLEDSRTNLWVGGDDGLFQFRDGRFFQVLGPAQNIGKVLNLYEDSLGHLWLGCTSGFYLLDNGRLTHLKPLGQELGSDMNVPNARAVIEDRQGRIWVGTGGEGLLCWEGGQWKRYSDKDGLISNYILALFVDTEGNLWVSTYGGGLSRWHDGRFLNYTTKNGLADDFITHISEDRNGWYWMGSSQKGIFRVARQQFEAFSRGEIQRLTSITYNRSDGLPSLDCNWTCQPAGWTARDGRLLLPTSRLLA